MERRWNPSYTYQTRPLQTDGITMAVLGVAALAAVRGLPVGGGGRDVEGGAAGDRHSSWAGRRRAGPGTAGRRPAPVSTTPSLYGRRSPESPSTPSSRSPPIMPQGTRGPNVRRRCWTPVAAAYRHYDHPAGARLKVLAGCGPWLPTANLHPTGSGLFGKRSVLGVREVGGPVASAWEPRDETPLVARSGARVLLPTARSVSERSVRGRHHHRETPREIRFSGDLVQPPPPLRGPHPHGQVHPHAPHSRPQDEGEGARAGTDRRHRGGGSPRRPGERPA